MRIIGIDIGAQGGIAILDGDIVQVFKIPKEANQLAGTISKITNNETLIFIEKVQLMRADMQTGGKAFGIMKMLKSYEKMETVLQLSGIPYVEVHPMTWQSRLNIRKRGEDKPERKRRYKQIASELFPTIKVTLWNSDALLIMHFGWRIIHIDPNWIINQAGKISRENQNRVIKLFSV